MTAALVRVVDHVPFEAAVTPAQALAYCRRVLKTSDGWAERPAGGAPWIIFETARPKFYSVVVPDHPKDTGMIVALCSDLVRLGFATKPSEVLRAMAAEVVTSPRSLRCNIGGLCPHHRAGAPAADDCGP